MSSTCPRHRRGCLAGPGIAIEQPPPCRRLLDAFPAAHLGSGPASAQCRAGCRATHPRWPAGPGPRPAGRPATARYGRCWGCEEAQTKPRTYPSRSGRDAGAAGAAWLEARAASGVGSALVVGDVDGGGHLVGYRRRRRRWAASGRRARARRRAGLEQTSPLVSLGWMAEGGRGEGGREGG